MEIEAKYRALTPISAEQVEAVALAPYRLGERVTFHFHDTLLDSAARALHAQRHTLRVRHDGAVYYVTLKGPATVQGSVHRRAEWEAPLGDAPFDPATWPEPLRQRVTALLGDAPLVPLLTLRNHRRAWSLHRAGTLVAELALDEGHFHAGAATEPFHEIEVELKGEGAAADLQAIAARLVAALPLAPEPRSKSQRALALLRASG